jgi:GGDEF domain-containing protein
VSDATEVDDVLREADVAMYTAKARGKGRYELAGSPA